jgi:hypothetical protein
MNYISEELQDYVIFIKITWDQSWLIPVQAEPMRLYKYKWNLSYFL